MRISSIYRAFRILIKDGEGMKRSNLMRYTYTAIILFLLYMWLVSTAAWEELIAGLIFSALIAAFTYRSFVLEEGEAITAKRVLNLLLYLPYFFWQIVKANLDVAYRVLHPKMPIRPGIVAVRTSLKSDIAKVALANSITLTPGTLTLDIIGDHLLIHWINVRHEDEKGATEDIVRPFEERLRGIFE